MSCLKTLQLHRFVCTQSKMCCVNTAILAKRLLLTLNKSNTFTSISRDHTLILIQTHLLDV